MQVLFFRGVNRDQNAVLFDGLQLFQTRLCFVVECKLRADFFLAAQVNVLVACITLHETGVCGVAQHGIENAEGAGLLCFVLDGENKLHAAVEIAGHPVRAAHVNARVAGIFKAEDTAVLQKLADNAHDSDVLADAFDARNEAADAAHDKLHAHTGLGGFIEKLDDLRVNEGVDFDRDAAGQTLFGVFGLLTDHVLKEAAHAVRCNDEVLVLRRTGIAGDDIEKGGRVCAELLVAGEQAEVGINFRGGVVVVAGAEVQVAADAVFLAADNERDFAVGLEAGQTVNDVAAGLFELLCPVDVVFFVKARFQLDKHRDLFAVFGGFDERRDDGRVAADAVERLLNGEYVFVFCGLCDELHDTVECLIWMVNKAVALTDGPENIGVAEEIARGCGGTNGRKAEFFAARDIRKFREEREVNGSLHLVDAAFIDVQRFYEKFAGIFIGVLQELQAHGTAALTTLDGLFNLIHKVVRFLVNGEVGVARDAERAHGFNLVQLEKLLKIIGDDVLEQDEAACVAVCGQLRKAWQNRRYLHDGKALFTLVFLGRKAHGEVQTFICEHRERAAAVYGERRQHGEQHAMKILVRKGSLLVRELFRRAELDFRLLFEDRQNRAV